MSERRDSTRKTLKRFVSKKLGIVSSLPADSEYQTTLLTFDDGPHPDITPRVLDLLDQYDTKAIFFIVGNRIAKAPQMLREVTDRGHQIGNHSYSHWLGSPPGYTEYLADLRKCQHKIEQLTGVACTMFRPPLGQISASSLLAARRLNLTYMLWSIDSGDWKIRDDNTATARGRTIAGALKPDDIALMHDDNPHTPKLLNALLEERTNRQSHQ